MLLIHHEQVSDSYAHALAKGKEGRVKYTYISVTRPAMLHAEFDSYINESE